jgi:retron-type reverse transcriptase
MIEQIDIQTAIATMQTKQDLLDVLNKIKQHEALELGVKDQLPISLRQLNYYKNPNNTRGRFISFTIPKKSGADRKITAPKAQSYKWILRCLNHLFVSIYTPSDYAMGFIKERSVVTNASVHVGKNYVFNIDLKDFFPSIEEARICARLQVAPFNFTYEVASTIAGLVTMKVESSKKDPKENIKYVLPQGSPVSPILTNIICDRLDRRLAGLAKRFRLSYTRYADDITFSSMHNVYQEGGEFRTELKRIIEDQSFEINDDKTRLQKKGVRQEVTGITVNDKNNVSKKYVRELRNILYIWKKYGYLVAYNKFMQHYTPKIKKLWKTKRPNMANVLHGKLMYLRMVKGPEDSTYQSPFNTYATLVGLESTKKQNINGITILADHPLLDFERFCNVSVVFTEYETYDGKGVAAYYEVGDKLIYLTIKKGLTIEKLSKKEDLMIAGCKDKKGVPFLIIHHKNKPLSYPQPKVDVDALNAELDNLLNI